MKKLPIGKQDFNNLVTSNCIYVDKTEYLLQLIETTAPIFLSRPRRFGKSLMVTTFRELFLGNKDLFQGTYAWHHWDFAKTYPVLHLDLSLVRGESKEIISEKLLELVYNAAEDAGISIKETNNPDIALSRLIRKAGKETRTVILIDEYDTPVLDNLYGKELADIKRILGAFYSVIKANEKFIHFLFITGISKFSHVGVFSTLNHLRDISLLQEYAGCLGYTEQEIARSFPEQIQKVKEQYGLSEEVFWKKLAHYYNGYSWDGQTFVYNPFSILLFFDRCGAFTPYWMATGSASFIVDYIQSRKLDIVDYENKQVPKDFLEQLDIEVDTPESFLTQAGYLTIKKSLESRYFLDFPNYEVRHAFNKILLSTTYSVDNSDLLEVRDHLSEALDRQAVPEIIEQFKIIYASVPYVHFDANRTEHFYTALLLMYLQAAGFEASPERLSNKGRLDLSLTFHEQVYIFELKVDSPQKALAQIIEKNYAGAYKNKQVILVGLQIDFTERNIIKYQAKTV
jgi:hypothetical protein